MIEEKTDYDTEIKELGGTLALAEALKNNDINFYVEYTGTAYTAILKEEGMEKDPDKVYDVVKKGYQDKYNIKWLEPLGFNNTFTFAINEEYAQNHNIKSFSDLAQFSGDLVLGTEIDFVDREDGYLGANKMYEFNFKDISNLDIGLKYDAMGYNKVDVINAFTTDGKLIELNLRVLEDDKYFFPPYYPAAAVHNDALEKYPELEAVINLLGGNISEDEMKEMNYFVDVEKNDIRKVAEDFLRKKELIE